MPSTFKIDCCADRTIITQLSAYQEYLVRFMTSQVVQRTRPLGARICSMRAWESKG